MNGRVSISIFILSPVMLALSLPSMLMAWKLDVYAVDMVIMEVSATTVAKRSANLFHTYSILGVVTRGLPLLLTRSCCHRTWV